MNKKLMYRKNGVLIGLLLLVAFVFAGCYSFEEKALEAEYKKQAEVNAVNYIKEKYGFEAKVKSVMVPRLGEFDPFPDNDVFVTMEWEDEEFIVRIAGDVVTSEGFDNYQQEEILSALKDELDTLTGITSEEVFAVYGDYREYVVGKKSWNGLVAPYFTGENTNEILTGGYERPEVMVTYINQEIAGIDAEEIKAQTGIEQLLFVDYDSKEHYKAILQSSEETNGTSLIPIWDTKRNLPYINEYLTVEYEETTYVNCEKKIVDGILFITEYPEETVTVEKLSGFTNSFNQKNSELVFDVYALETESDIVHVFVPIEALAEIGRKTPGFAAMTGTKEIHVSSDLTADGKYVGGTIYTRNYEGPIEFSVYVREE
ncbi:MAG: hypothetical protein IJW37_09890 [Lachnospiraceae bacterium]|nr:hypothetical protein [Lachnospiraceae bacterium]